MYYYPEDLGSPEDLGFNHMILNKTGSGRKVLFETIHEEEEDGD